MDQKQNGSSSSKVLGIVFFTLGFAVALASGWLVFPELLYSQKAQPINFSHAAHSDSDCDSCHALRPDGTYSGIPRIDKCKECHESAQGSTEDERVLVEEYVAKDREIPWKVYAWQPDNVFFSHAPHKGQGLECTRCHRDVAKEEKTPKFRENLITGYSISTMKMVECEKCHADKGVTNNCEMCHK
jgi:hypothetical protein